MRVRRFDATHFASDTEGRWAVGYSGRLKAIKLIADGAVGYAAMSSPPNGLRGPGVWAKHADLSKVFPVVEIERPAETDDVFVLLGKPIQISQIV